MSSCESVYATSQKGYEYIQRSSDHPSIIRAKQKNILLSFVRCNEIYKGQSHFKSKRQEEYYKAYCRSAPSKKTSFMFTSEITNGSSLPQEKPLSQLDELGVQINRKKNRPQLFESSDKIHQKIEREWKSSSGRKEYRVEVEQKKEGEILKNEIQNTPKFKEKNGDEWEKGQTNRLKDKYISDYKIMKQVQNEGQNKNNHQIEEAQNSPHQLKIHLPYRLHSHKKPSQGLSPFEYQSQLQKLKKDLEQKKKEVEGYKAYLEESRKKQNQLLRELNQLREEQGGMGRWGDREDGGSGRGIGLVEITFILILLVKMNFRY